MNEYELKLRTLLEALQIKQSKIDYILRSDLQVIKELGRDINSDLQSSKSREELLFIHGLGLYNCQFISKLRLYEFELLLKEITNSGDNINLNKLLLILHHLDTKNSDLIKYIKMHPCEIISNLPKLYHETDYKILEEKLESLLKGLDLDVGTCKELSAEELKAIGEQILKDMI